MLERFYFKDINNKQHCYATEKLKECNIKNKITEKIILETKRIITNKGIVAKYYFFSELLKNKIEISEKVFEKLKDRFLELEKYIKESLKTGKLLNLEFSVEIDFPTKLYYNDKILINSPKVKKFSLILDDKDEFQYTLLLEYKLNEDTVIAEYLEISEDVAKYMNQNTN